MATYLANEKAMVGTPKLEITYGMLRRIKRNETWLTYLELVRKGGMEAARAMFMSDMPRWYELHKWAAEHAREEGDHRAMAALTVPALDRFAPKKDDQAQARQTIVIQLGSAQGFAALHFDQPTQDVHAVQIDRDDPTRTATGELVEDYFKRLDASEVPRLPAPSSPPPASPEPPDP